jgi:hypothetical protein
MPDDVLDLWPTTIQVAPLTPRRVLELQAERLRQRTNGLLVAEIDSSGRQPPNDYHHWEGPVVVHKFEIVAPTLNGYRHQLLVCTHEKSFGYPVQVDSGSLPDEVTVASSQDEFIRVVKSILNANRTIALIESLLARIAEDRSQKTAPTAGT